MTDRYTAVGATNQDRPNVVILVMDTTRYANVFPSDTTVASTLESLAESGTRFNQAVVPASWTLPSHASLFTGTYPSKHGVHANYTHLDDHLSSLPAALADVGYETVAVSNNTWISEEFGFARGFETFYNTWQYVQSDTDLGRIAREEEGFDKLRKTASTLVDGNPLTNLLNAVYGQFFRKTHDDGASRTNKWIDDWLRNRNESEPFFLFVNYLEPHLEYHPPKPHAELHLPEDVTYEQAMEIPQDAWGYIAGNVDMTKKDFEVLRALYLAEISYLDEKISEVVEMLKAAGEWEDTLFIVTSDHGENIGEHGLMDHQYALYDTLLHVPLIIHGEPFETAEIDNLVQLVDIAPTILDALNIDAPEVREQFQGISFHPDVDDTRQYAIAEYLAPQPSMEALAKRVDEVPDYVRKYNRSLRAIRTEQYKYIRGSDGSQELYDIKTDPREEDDIADTHEDVVAALDASLDNWVETFDHAEQTGDVDMNEDTKTRLEDLGYLQ